MRRALMALGLALSVGVPALLTLQKERLAASGEPVLLELAPVDPRSLIQGDYMVLRYAISRELGRSDTTERWPSDGELVVALDERGVAGFVRRHQGEDLGEGERLLRYRLRGQELRLGAESFFFQEGNAPHYEQARYGELVVTPGGEAMLVGLRDEDLRALGPEGEHPLQRR